MPWDIKKDGRCPADKPFAVVGGSSGDRLAGCHPSEEAAREQVKALYANEPDAELNRSEPVMYTTPPSVQP